MGLFRPILCFVLPRHYSAKSARGEGAAAAIVGLSAYLLASGCAAQSPFFQFESHVVRRQKSADDTWRTELLARDRVCVGREYLRLETTTQEEEPAVGRIYELAEGSYWEYERDQEETRNVRMWPAAEIVWRLEEAFAQRRREARGQVARLGPLIRPSRWRRFAGNNQEEPRPSRSETILGVAAHERRVSAFPGATWELWIPAASLLPSRHGVNLFMALGLPPDRGSALMRRMDRFPIEIDIASLNKTWQIRYRLSTLPLSTARETAVDVLPAGALKRIREREARLSGPATLLGLLDQIAELEHGVTQLGVCVRLTAALDPTTVRSAVKRFATVTDGAARRYLMFHVALDYPDQAMGPLQGLVKSARIEVSRDAAEVCARLLAPPQAAQMIAAVLRRFRRMAPAYPTPEERAQRSELYLWATDLLRVVTGRDLGFWPGDGEEEAIARWLRFLDTDFRGGASPG